MKYRLVVVLSLVFIGLLISSKVWRTSQASELSKIYLKYGTLDTDWQPSLPIPPGLDVPGQPLAGGELIYLIQFVGPIQTGWRGNLDQTIGGIEWGDYVANFAFLTRMTPTTAGTVRERPFVEAVVEIFPAYKVNRDLLTPDGQQIDMSLPTGVLMVTTFTTTDHDEVESLVTALGGTVQEAPHPATLSMFIELPTANILPLVASGRITYVAPRHAAQPINDNTRWIAQTNMVDYTPLYEAGIRGEGQVIAVDERHWAYLNTGDDAHCQFTRPGHVTILENTPMVCDENCGHATFVLSAAGGDQGEPDGGLYNIPDNFDGIAPAADLILQVGFDGIYDPAEVAYNEGARIWNLSFSFGGEGEYLSSAMDVDRIMWDYPDFLVVAAAGNLGENSELVINPGTAKNVITVGGSEPFPDQENRLLNETGGGSRIGPTNDGRIKPTVMLTGFPNVARKAPFATCDVEEQFGTSFASPAVAGSAALVRQYLQEIHGITSPAAALIKAFVMNSARNMVGEDVLGPIPSNGQGWGRVTLNDTLRVSQVPGELEMVYHEAGLTTGEEITIILDVNSTRDWESLKATLVWTDFPGNTIAKRVIANDLDLRLIASGGAMYYGNVFSNGHSTTGGEADRVNVEEQVLLLDEAGQLPAGSYQIVVSAHNVPVSPQPFALVINLSPAPNAHLPLVGKNLSGGGSGYPGPATPAAPYP